MQELVGWRGGSACAPKKRSSILWTQATADGQKVCSLQYAPHQWIQEMNSYLFGQPFLHILQHFLKYPISCAPDYCRQLLDPQCILHLRWKTAVKRHKNKEVQLVCSLLSWQILSIGYCARLIGGNFLLLECRLVNKTQHKASFPSHL